ncbi:MAG: SipW-dependent-type signal peptide-containing protein [Lachnospiraceae bacterium]|nr:SipW-dependent-type signal peptide-containing protein [Lachnospiraceae bacterium]
MKKRIFYIAAILICLSLTTGGTLAYFNTTETATNVITTGGVSIDVLVNGSLESDSDEPIPVMPATEVDRSITVRSNKQAAWIRVNYTLTVYDAENKKMEIPADELKKVIVITPDNTNWTQKDGWWYYNTAVKNGETTAPLFEKIAFSGPDMDNKYQLCTLVVDINAQAVQQANNKTSATEALGWPEIGEEE